jgi:hypothetical protein
VVTALGRSVVGEYRARMGWLTESQFVIAEVRDDGIHRPLMVSDNRGDADAIASTLRSSRDVIVVEVLATDEYNPRR